MPRVSWSGRWMVLLVAVAVLLLGVGVPAFAFADRSSMMVVGRIVDVDPTHRAILVSTEDGTDVKLLADQQLTLHLTATQWHDSGLDVAHAKHLAPGRKVRARALVRPGHAVRWIQVAAIRP